MAPSPPLWARRRCGAARRLRDAASGRDAARHRGFLGNAIDRILLGHVRDWLAVGPTVWNLAYFFLAAAIAMVVAAGIRSFLADSEKPSQLVQREEVKK